MATTTPAPRRARSWGWLAPTPLGPNWGWGSRLLEIADLPLHVALLPLSWTYKGLDAALAKLLP